MTRWDYSTKVVTQASKEAIWKILSDVSIWPQFNEDIEWAELNGPFTPGTKGKIKTKGWMTSTFTLLEVRLEEGFSTTTSMPMTTIKFTYDLKQISENEVEIVLGASLDGLMTPILSGTLGKKLEAGLPRAAENLSRLASVFTK